MLEPDIHICEHCGGEFDVGGKMATRWPCPHCDKLTKVVDDDDDDDDADDAPAQFTQ